MPDPWDDNYGEDEDPDLDMDLLEALLGEDDIRDLLKGRQKPTRREGEEEFYSFLINRYLNGSMTAKEVCITAYWAVAAGATGNAEKLAMRPDKDATGHYSRHLKTLGDRCKQSRAGDHRSTWPRQARLRAQDICHPLHPPTRNLAP